MTVMTMASHDSLGKVVLLLLQLWALGGWRAGWLPAKRSKMREKHSVWREIEEDEGRFRVMTM